MALFQWIVTPHYCINHVFMIYISGLSVGMVCDVIWSKRTCTRTQLISYPVTRTENTVGETFKRSLSQT